MRFATSEAEYIHAIDDALAITDGLDETRPIRTQDHALRNVLACAYDTSVPADIMGALEVSDIQRKELLLTLIIGCSIYGCPSHPRSDDLLRLGNEL